MVLVHPSDTPNTALLAPAAADLPLQPSQVAGAVTVRNDQITVQLYQ